MRTARDVLEDLELAEAGLVLFPRAGREAVRAGFNCAQFVYVMQRRIVQIPRREFMRHEKQIDRKLAREIRMLYLERPR